MASEEFEKDWHSTQNAAYLDLLESRLNEPRLHWVDQFVEIINREVISGDLKGQASISINDYGCNVGHFFRGIEDIRCAVKYRGFDISGTYLSIARRTFGREHFHQLNIEQHPVDAMWPQSNVAIISATLEHLDKYSHALGNIFSHTMDLVVLRTFVGKDSLLDKCRTFGANSDFLIRQFTIDDLTKISGELGWKYNQEIDQATLGKTKMVCNGNSVPRAQTVMVFTKLASKDYNAIERTGLENG
jgi:hypothetical protein